VTAFDVPDAAGNDRAGGHYDDDPFHPITTTVFCHTIAIRLQLPFGQRQRLTDYWILRNCPCFHPRALRFEPGAPGLRIVPCLKSSFHNLPLRVRSRTTVCLAVEQLTDEKVPAAGKPLS